MPPFFLALMIYFELMERIYLDANGSTPALKGALDKIKGVITLIGNPSSFHEHGRTLRALLDHARHDIAQAINARGKDLIFCSGASEANRLFIDSLVCKARELNRPLSVLMSPFEHPSLLKPAIMAAKEGALLLSFIDIDHLGHLLPKKEQLLTSEVLICCQAHNETGLIPDLNGLMENIGEETLVMSDISQGFSRLDPLSERIDAMSFSAQKMGGLAGSGGLILRGNAKKLKAPWAGGNQEGGFRPGTEASVLHYAMHMAALEVKTERELYKKISEFRDIFENMIVSSCDVEIIGKDHARLPNTSAITFKNIDPDALRIGCDMAGLSVGFGSACSGLAPEGSFALKTLGLSLAEQRSSVRFSFSSTATLDEAKEAARRMIAIVQ